MKLIVVIGNRPLTICSNLAGILALLRSNW
jgi:hypothetical protein